jgi:uncharacterized protein
MAAREEAMLTLDDLLAMRQAIRQIAARHKARNVRVFGSVARGQAGPDSDVDFLVTFDDGASLYEMSGLMLDLKDLLGRDVDVADDATHDQRFLQRIANELVAL